MSKRFLALVFLVMTFSKSSAPDVILRGRTTDCFQDSLIHITAVDISAFDASLNTEMVDSLRAMDRLNFTDSAETAMSRMEIQYNRVIHLAESSKALGRTTTDSSGSFALSVPPVDSVVVFAAYDAEDEPFPYSYKVIGGRADRSVDLDMSRGDCDYINKP
jgi:hypothetical protein